MVASAGNDANQKSNFPAAYATEIATGAVDANDGLANFSSFGGWMDVTAPGVDVPAATVQGVECGTSMPSRDGEVPYIR